MLIVGLTGSIGMGKSATAAVFRRLGIPVHDADAAVHDLLDKGGGAVEAVGRSFPGVVSQGRVDRRQLGERVFGDRAALGRLEAILHPMVRRRQERFLRHAAMQRRRVVVLDVPLLFETGGEVNCDIVVVVSAPAFLQAERVLRRPGVTRARLRSILTSQMSDAEKRRRADFVVATGLGHAYTRRVVVRIVRMARVRQLRRTGRRRKRN